MRISNHMVVFHRWLKRNVQELAPYMRVIPKPIRRKFLEVFLDPKKDITPIPLPFKVKAHPKGINLIGFFRVENGLAQGAKLYAKALEKGNLSYALVNADFLSFLPQNDITFDKWLKPKPIYGINVTHINADQYSQAQAQLSPSAFDRRYNIAVWLWELENIPNEWYWAFPYLNEIWVPSNFVKNAIEKVAPIPVSLIPYGIEAPVDSKCDRAFFGLPEDRFLVLCMFDSNSYFSRKNPLGALVAFTKAFGNAHSKASLVMKVSNAKEAELERIRMEMGSPENLILFSQTFEKKQVNALIRCCDVFLSLHRSEGFGLVLAEAMYLGVPVVATNWSANTDFMNADVACMVDYELIPTNGEYQFDHAQQRWADANTDQAADYLAKLFKDKAFYEKISKAGERHIREHLSLEKSRDLMEKRISEIYKNYTKHRG